MVAKNGVEPPTPAFQGFSPSGPYVARAPMIMAGAAELRPRILRHLIPSDYLLFLPVSSGRAVTGQQ
jgi:hypothetical protein